MPSLAILQGSADSRAHRTQRGVRTKALQTFKHHTTVCGCAATCLGGPKKSLPKARSRYRIYSVPSPLLCTSAQRAALIDSSRVIRWVAPGKGGPWQPEAKGSRSWGWGPTSPPHLMVRGGGGCDNAPPAWTPGPLRTAKASEVAQAARGGAF